MKVALVTGGSRGIGAKLVRELMQAGYSTAFTYVRNQSAAESLVAEVHSAEQKSIAFQADVKDFSRAHEVVAEVEKTLGPINLLVNNAGIRCDKPLHNMSADDWQLVMDTNLTGMFNYSRAVIVSMLRRGGVIINVTSVSGISGIPGQTNYSASKAGMIGFTRSLAKEAARFGVRVNALAPGYIETDMVASLDEVLRARLFSQIPMRRLGSPEEVARLVVFLASDDAAYITGQVFAMDGGLT